MRCGIVGAGKMGREIEAVAGRRGHEVVWRLTSRDNARAAGLTRERLETADVVFEFTSPASVTDNLLALARAGARVVCGTTGWAEDLPRVTEAFLAGNGALVHAANFSVGVRQFFDLATLRRVSGRGASRREEGRSLRHGAHDRDDPRARNGAESARHERACGDDPRNPPTCLRIAGGRGRDPPSGPQPHGLRQRGRLGRRADRRALRCV